MHNIKPGIILIMMIWLATSHTWATFKIMQKFLYIFFSKMLRKSNECLKFYSVLYYLCNQTNVTCHLQALKNPKVRKINSQKKYQSVFNHLSSFFCLKKEKCHFFLTRESFIMKNRIQNEENHRSLWCNG